MADHLAGRYGAGVLLVGSEEDEELAEEIRRAVHHPVTDLTGRLGLRQTAAVLQASHLFIGNDSGPTHMAEAVGTPVVAIFGPTDPVNFRPLLEAHRVVRRDVCGPCIHWLEAGHLYLHAFRDPTCTFDCIRQVTVEDVLAAAEPLLEQSLARSGAAILKGS